MKGHLFKDLINQFADRKGVIIVVKGHLFKDLINPADSRVQVPML